MEESGHITFQKGGSGGFHFGCVDASLDWRYDDALARHKTSSYCTGAGF
jgi:hypothetical protein